MAYSDEEYPGQTLWQSVLLFCCKGMIEGIMVLLFLWLLVQVLFTRQLEVHLQVLLLVGLLTFCLSLLLGCVLSWRRSRSASAQEKPPAAQVETVNQQLYEELDGDTLDFPSTFTSPAPSERDFTPRPFTSGEENEASYFSLRRLSSPLLTAPVYRPIHPGRGSLPTLPRLGQAWKLPLRRCTVTGDKPSAEKPIPLVPLTKQPCVHLSLTFSAEQQILTVTVLNLTSQRLEEVQILGSLPPLHPTPTQASAPSSLSPDSNARLLRFNVCSTEELQNCKLRLTVNREGSDVGVAELPCAGRDWKHPLHVTKELLQNTG